MCADGLFKGGDFGGDFVEGAVFYVGEVHHGVHFRRAVVNRLPGGADFGFRRVVAQGEAYDGADGDVAAAGLIGRGHVGGGKADGGGMTVFCLLEQRFDFFPRSSGAEQRVVHMG